MIAITKSRNDSYIESDPDVRLMLRVRDGDAQAAAELVERYYDYVHHTIQYLLGGSEHAADLTQDVFMRLFRASARYEPRARLSTWLFTIVNNVVSNERRRIKNRREVNIATDEPANGNPLEYIGPRTNSAAPSAEIESNERGQLVHHAIDQLNRRQRDAIELFYFHGLSCDTIAARLRISSVATRSLLHRARVSLRRCLTKHSKAGTLGD